MKEDLVILVLILLVGASLSLGIFFLPKNNAVQSDSKKDRPADKITIAEPTATDMAKIHSTEPQTDGIPSTPTDLPANFHAVEVVANDLPASAEFWTQAYCPGAGSAFEYSIPDGYRVESCEYGSIGSHNGCSYCTMAKIKLALGKSDEPSEPGTCGTAINYKYDDNGPTESDDLCAQGSAEGAACYYDDKGGCKWCWSCGIGSGKVTCCEYGAK